MKTIIQQLDKLVQEISHNQRCVICHKPAQCTHHIVRRDDKMARYDLANLLFVCKDCHDKIHDGHINEYDYISEERKEFLIELKKMSYKDFLIFVARQTEDEYLKDCKKRLRRVIDANS